MIASSGEEINVGKGLIELLKDKTIEYKPLTEETLKGWLSDIYEGSKEPKNITISLDSEENVKIAKTLLMIEGVEKETIDQLLNENKVFK
jgi:hypothetical protein